MASEGRDISFHPPHWPIRLGDSWRGFSLSLKRGCWARVETICATVQSGQDNFLIEVSSSLGDSKLCEVDNKNSPGHWFSIFVCSFFIKTRVWDEIELLRGHRRTCLTSSHGESVSVLSLLFAMIPLILVWRWHETRWTRRGGEGTGWELRAHKAWQHGIAMLAMHPWMNRSKDSLIKLYSQKPKLEPRAQLLNSAQRCLYHLGKSEQGLKYTVQGLCPNPLFNIYCMTHWWLV